MILLTSLINRRGTVTLQERRNWSQGSLSFVYKLALRSSIPGNDQPFNQSSSKGFFNDFLLYFDDFEN